MDKPTDNLPEATGSPTPQPAHKKPATRTKEVTRGARPKKGDHNFSQSRDVHEDRGTRQIKNTIRVNSAPRGR